MKCEICGNGFIPKTIRSKCCSRKCRRKRNHNRHKNTEKYKKYVKGKKRRALIRSYDISVEEYNNMFTEQNGKCKICGIHQSTIGKSLSIDHNHYTGKVRGLICQKCNSILGLSNDSTEILLSCIEYLKQ